MWDTIVGVGGSTMSTGKKENEEKLLISYGKIRGDRKISDHLSSGDLLSKSLHWHPPQKP